MGLLLAKLLTPIRLNAALTTIDVTMAICFREVGILSVPKKELNFRVPDLDFFSKIPLNLVLRKKRQL